MTDQIGESAGALIEVLRKHATVLRDSADDPRKVTEVTTQLRTAARNYAEPVLNFAGWGNPFNDLDGEDDDEDEGISSHPTDSGPQTTKLSLTVRRDFLVVDQAGAEAVARLHGVPDANVGGALAELFLAADAGWAGPAFKPAGEIFSVVEVDRTLFEMTATEVEALEL